MIDPTQSHSMRIERFYLGTAASNVPFDAEGHYFRVRSVSRSTVTIQVGINAPTGKRVQLSQGQGWVHLPFSRLWFTWTAQDLAGVPDWIDLEIYGSPWDARPELFNTFNAVDASFVYLTGHALEMATAIPTFTGYAPADTGGLACTVEGVSTSTTLMTGFYTVPAGKIANVDAIWINVAAAGTAANFGDFAISDALDVVRYTAPVYSVAPIQAFSRLAVPAGWKFIAAVFGTATVQAVLCFHLVAA